MAFEEKNIARQAISDTVEVLYTVPSGVKTIVKDIHVCNNSDTPCWVSLWLVPAGDDVSTENVMFYQWKIPANDFVHWTGWQILEEGETIQAQSEIEDQLAINISGATL